MSFIDALHISASGLSAQRVRMNVVSSNLANTGTTQTAEGGPYKRKMVILGASPVNVSFQHALEEQVSRGLCKVRVLGIKNDSRPPLSRYDPGHPDANAEGYVVTPNINLIEEMVDMMSATRNYEANVAAVNATKNMALRALEIGRK